MGDNSFTYVEVGFEIKEDDICLVTTAETRSCPKGHPNPAGPFCSECGSKADFEKSYQLTEGALRLFKTLDQDPPENPEHWRECLDITYHAGKRTRVRSNRRGQIYLTIVLHYTVAYNTGDLAPLTYEEVTSFFNVACELQACLLGPDGNRPVLLFVTEE